MTIQRIKYAFSAAFALIFLLFLPTAQAFQDARVLPAGRFRVTSYYGQSEQVGQTYDSKGVPSDLTAAYNIELSSKTLKGFNDQMKTLVDVLNSLNYRYDPRERRNGYHGIVLTDDIRAQKLGDAISRGKLDIDAWGMRRQTNLALNYGITDRLSVAIVGAYLENQARVSYKIKGVNTAKDIAAALEAIGPVETEFDLVTPLRQIAAVNKRTFQSLLVEKGYDTFGDFREKGFGDTLVGSRLNYLNLKPTSSTAILSSLQGLLTVPTGRLSAPRKLQSIDFGQGAWDLGLTHVFNAEPARFVTISHSAGYTYRFKSHRKLRVPEKGDFVPDASDEEIVAMKLGDKYATALGLRFKLGSYVSVDSGYEWAWKRSDRYKGLRDRVDYGTLSRDTQSYLETVQLGASVNTVTPFMRGDFPLPGDLSFNYYQPIRGKNTKIAPYGVAEFSLYF